MGEFAQSLCCKSSASKSSDVVNLGILPLGDKLKGNKELCGNERDEGVDCSDATFHSNSDGDNADLAQ